MRICVFRYDTILFRYRTISDNGARSATGAMQRSAGIEIHSAISQHVFFLLVAAMSKTQRSPLCQARPTMVSLLLVVPHKKRRRNNQTRTKKRAGSRFRGCFMCDCCVPQCRLSHFTCLYTSLYFHAWLFTCLCHMPAVSTSSSRRCRIPAVSHGLMRPHCLFIRRRGPRRLSKAIK